MVIPERTERKYESYPDYKDSGVEWLGQIPVHWDIKKIKWDTPVFRGASPRPIDDPVYFDDEGEYAWVRIADVTASGTYLERTTQRLSELGASLSVKMEHGELFLSIAGSVGKPCITNIKCCIHDGFVYFPRLKCDTKFLYYIFASGEPYKGLGKLGTQLNLNTDTVASIYMGFPSSEEQQAIADLLDRETSRIDELIARKQRLIELLQEQRTAQITHTVTKGLNPSVPMKDSGVEWLGEVPAHWEVKKLKYVSSVKFSSVDKHSKEDEQPVYLCNYTDIYNNDIILPTQDFMAATATKNEMALFSLKKDDVIVTKDSEDWKDIAVPGYVAVNLPGVICGYHLALIRTDSLVITGRYLFWSFRARNLNHQFVIASTGITRFGLGKYWLDNSLFFIPPIQEQQAIADHLDRETARIDSLIGRINQAIEKLQEYRSAFITAAVTGKIDVRQHVS